jgi:hypothetical protein
MAAVVSSRERVERYVADLAELGTPYVRGGSGDKKLSVRWSSFESSRTNTRNWSETSAHPLLLAALLQPKALADVICSEIDREANAEMPIAQREARIDELDDEIEELQRRASDLTHAICAAGGRKRFGNAPASAILGVRVSEPVVVRKRVAA